MAVWRYSAGPGVAVELSSDPEALLRGMVQRLAPTVSGALERAADTLEASARGSWPVGKRRGRDVGRPHSRDMFTSALEVSPSEIRGVVRNTAKYAYFIRSSQNGLGGKSAYVTLVRKPAQLAARALATELASDLARLP